MQAHHPRFHLGIFGGSGSGKSTYARKAITGMPATCVFIFDPELEFSQTLRLPVAASHSQLDAAIRTGWVCFDPHTLFAGQVEDALDYFCRLAMAAAGLLPGRKFFVVDELGRYTSGNDVPLSLKIILQAGRRYGLDGVFIAQQPNELHNTVRCQLSEVVLFQLTDQRALEFPRRFGFDTEAVKALGQFQFICRNNRGQETRG
jgi:ABC-type dipeptide/oligopeptide/nickel transport system ATPase component